MEATGVYWKPVHWVLEAPVPEVWVINARHMRNVPGAKLSTGETYDDLGGDYFDRRRTSAARQRRLVAQLEAMGHRVTLEPAA
jgi:transposase